MPFSLRQIPSGILIVVAIALLCGVSADTECGFTTQRIQCGELSCDKKLNICVPCSQDADCYPHAMYCDAGNGHCLVKPISRLINFGTFAAMVGAFAVCSIGVIAGVGGGGILVPMFCAMMSVPMQFSVGLSQSTICGQTTLNMYYVVQKVYPHPTWKRPLINYQYLSLLLPLSLMGTLTGGILSRLCPDLLRLVLLFILLTLALYRAIKKMKQQYREDKMEKNAAVVEGPSTQDTSATAAVPSTEVEHIDQEQYPREEMIANFSSFFVVLFFNILRGYCSCGGALYWLCVLVPLAFLCAVFYYNHSRLRALAEEKPAALTFEWNQRNSVFYPMAAVVAGVAASMLGIGGGMVLGFVLYEVGFIPEEASMTGGMATFFMAFASALQLLVSGRLSPTYGLVFYVVGTASTGLGQFVFMEYIRAHGLRYLIVGSLALIIGGSLLILGAYGIYNAVITTQNGGSIFSPGRVCSLS